jgi:hypothetical protein
MQLYGNDAEIAAKSGEKLAEAERQKLVEERDILRAQLRYFLGEKRDNDLERFLLERFEFGTLSCLGFIIRSADSFSVLLTWREVFLSDLNLSNAAVCTSPATFQG